MHPLLLASLAAGALKVGDPAPAFVLTSHAGKAVSLEDYAGRKVLLWFYPRAGTGG